MSALIFMKLDSQRPVSEGRRERNKREKLERIVDASRHLFHTQGYANTTTQQIATAAGIAAGTLFLYVKSKEDLLVLVFREEMGQLIEDTYGKIKKSDSLLKQTMRLFNGFIEYHARDVAISRELIRELTFLSNEARVADINNIAGAITSKLSFFVDRAKERGKLSEGVDSSLFAQCLFSIYYQQLQNWLSGYVSRRVFQRNLESMLALIIEGKTGERSKASRRS